ncbi:PREDICTED: geranylgeranyl transferase type-2 subunit alpha 1 [Nelumbo nucifera]|uniref:Geranylgeranyl transferase type-2 subunit alpha n=1 Tax=Nelumbo nucifera TaxID=4432 RepID=A0A1U7ZHC5_NELNU|nr:PREDICTED: geranylgeranyl transferase type-2 subunit alpha 1 [Nelumbo nucifera]
MHGRPRKPQKPVDDASIAKAAKLRVLQAQFFQNHHDKIYAKEALEISAKLLETNPEAYTAWNYRKLAVEHNLRSETDPDAIKAVLDEELRVVESALRRNFKCYGAWHHRKWVLNKGYSSVDHEFRLLDQFQKADSRNFHAWSYRRFVAALKNMSEEEELKYTTDMIETNFSNYSAWHNRSVLLSHLLKQKIEGFTPREKVLTEEYELVHQALFTDPDDQSGWFYHFWLLDQTVTPGAPVLVSSWPAHGSDLFVSFKGNLDGGVSSSFTSFCSDKGAFPLIIYFNQSVGGINSSTVTVKHLFDKNEDLIWVPLATNNSGNAQAWVTFLRFPDVKDDSLKAYPVEVKVGHSQCAFTVSLRSIDSKHGEGGSDMEMIVWKDDSFHASEPLLLSPPVVSLDQATTNKEPEQIDSRWHEETLANEIALFQELLSEINCKIGKLTLARLLRAHDKMIYKMPFADEKTHSKEVLDLFSDLMKLDPSHSRYYKDEHSLVLMEQVVSNRESLLTYCWKYGEAHPSYLCNPICLRLSKLSLSRIGSFENLLWVQMLDLSHNELWSIEGLEAMQLLSCLNLSNNKLRSFTALEPLKLLKSLKVLNISYNEIGAHSIDTSRYLFSSPLSHTVGDDWNIDAYVTDGVKMNYWEAAVIFKGLYLTQLDVVGNAIVDEKFNLFLTHILPSLVWLDGDRVY